MSHYRDSVGVSRSRRLATVAALAAAIAVPAEGLRQWAYSDIANPALLTVCYGSTANVKPGVFYSLDKCRAMLTEDMLHAVELVDVCAPGLPVPVLAAFADAVYNMGPKIACDTSASTAARLLDARDYTAACRQLPKWDKARVAGVLVALPGLTKRRKEEMDLCLTWPQSVPLS